MSRLFIVIVALTISCTTTPPVPTAPATQQDARNGEPTPLPPGAALTSQPTVKPMPAQLPNVLARVNGQAISKAEFEQAVQELEGRAGGPVPVEQRDSIYRNVLDQMVGRALLTQEAAARKVDVSDAELDARMVQIRGQFPSEEVFAQMLAQRRTTLAEVRTSTRRDMAVSKLLQLSVEATSAVTPAQIDDFYAKNPDQFQQAESVRASHILVSAPRDGDAAAKTQARARAEQVLKDVKAGKDFAALAKQHSQDPGSAPNGGDLGYFTAGQMVGPFNDAAFSLKPGATSGIVETDFGFHIIRVVDKKAGRTMPLDEIRPQLTQFLQNQNRQQQTEAFLSRLRAKGKVEILI